MDREKREWLSSIGAKEFPEPVKYFYTFPGFDAEFNLTERELNETSLEELKSAYKKNYEFAIKALEWRILRVRNHSDFVRT